MLRHRILSALGICLAFAAVGQATGQDQPKFATREQVNAYYAEQYNKLEKDHIVALTKVASTQDGDAANATYRLLFNLAIARNAYMTAEPAAEHVLEKGNYGSDVDMLAHFVNVVAEADRGEYDESLQHLKDYVQARKAAAPDNDPRKGVDADTTLAIGEAYFQRLVGAGRHDVAKKLCEMAATSPHEAVREHFAKRAKRLDMVGKPAPALAGMDVDGKSVKLADHKGKVVLVDFWATWCPPCSMQMIRLNTLRDKFKDQGFEVVGVNVDSLREGADGAEGIMPVVRRYLIDHQAAFPNVVCPKGDTSLPMSFGVEEIPANFLIDRQGNIIQFELNEGGLVRAVEQAMRK